MLFGSSMDAGSIRDPSLELKGSSSEDTTARSKFLQFGGSKKRTDFPRRMSIKIVWVAWHMIPRGTAWRRIVDRSG